MVHYTCDLCGKDLGAHDEPRFVVKITAQAAHDPERICDEDLDVEQLEAISSLLNGGESRTTNQPTPDFAGFRFDLCTECHARFVRDPLGRELYRSAHFSKN